MKVIIHNTQKKNILNATPYAAKSNSLEIKTTGNGGGKRGKEKSKSAIQVNEWPIFSTPNRSIPEPFIGGDKEGVGGA